MTVKRTLKTSRITVEALKFYVPLYQAGDKAESLLMDPENVFTQGERNHLETALRVRELALKKITELTTPLMTREIRKAISTSHLRSRDDVFDVMFYAGVSGIRRGLRKFEIDKLQVSSTNYLMQWVMTYAKKELLALEAPFGIPPSRFAKYKKISAVRKKLTEQLQRNVTNEEILEFFHSGNADLITMNGKLSDRGKISQANQAINMELVIEQDDFEKNMLTVNLFDPLDDYSSNIKLSEETETIFDETVFGVFSKEYKVTDEARVTIMSDLNSNNFSENEIMLLKSMSQKTYKKLSGQWMLLISDVNGPFYEFLTRNVDTEFKQFDVLSTINNIETYDKKVNSSLYAGLFKNNEKRISRK